MPELNGIEATRQIVAQSPHIGVLVLTMFEDDDSVFAAMRARAKRYLLKGADQDDIVRAIAAVGSGEAIFGPDIAKRVIEYFTVPRASHAAQAFPELTEREREVLELVAQGHNNASMALHFVLSQKTIRNHVSNIFTKLQVADRAQAIVRAREAGMGQQGTQRSELPADEALCLLPATEQAPRCARARARRASSWRRTWPASSASTRSSTRS